MSATTQSWLDELEQLRTNREKLVQCGERIADPWVRQKLESLLHDNEACVHAYARATLAATEVPNLRRHRRVAQAAADRHARRQPTGWRWWRKRAWEQEHLRRRSKLRRAVRDEQEALCGTPSAVQPALANRVRVLRKEVEAMELLAGPKPAEAGPLRDPEQLVKDIRKLCEQKAATRIAAVRTSP